jgi:hypothetical protein
MEPVIYRMLVAWIKKGEAGRQRCQLRHLLRRRGQRRCCRRQQLVPLLRGAGDDYVAWDNYITFVGGAGNDSVTNLYSGTFNGGESEDSITTLYGGNHSSVELLP